MARPGHVSDADTSDLGVVRSLLLEYADSLAFALDFQGFDDELASLPGAYAPPGGALLVARTGGAVCGCVALRRLDDDTCELKRLYVRPAARRGGFGRQLTEAAIDRARTLGYERMRLDTVPGMERAQALYIELGFHEIDPYRQNPVPGARFLELRLTST